MALKKTALAVLLSTAMVAPLVVTPADAAVQKYEGGYQVAQDATNGAFDGVLIQPSRFTDLHYAHPYSAPGGLSARLFTDVWVNSEGVSLENNTTVTGKQQGNANVVTMVTKDGNVTITRTFTIEGRSTTVKTVVEAPQGTRVQLDSTVLLKALEADYTGTFDAGANRFHLAPVKPGYEVDVTFGEGTFATAADKDFKALNAATGEEVSGHIGASAEAQRGRWVGRTDASGRFETSVRIDVSTQQDAADTDGDGLPDIWEEEGFTLADGTVIDLPKWGADPQHPDVFLQLNWMPSEWEQRGCADRGRFNPTAKDVLSFEECATLNKNFYRPTRKMLQDLEALFRDNGINLHIDAGALYAPGIPVADRRGGQNKEKLPYAKYSFDQDGRSRVDTMKGWHNDLLGERDAVWHVGVIGDTIAPGELSSGLGLQGESFFVAKGAGLTTEEEFKGTILHEFGHVLGLDHDGIPTEESHKYAELLAGYPSGQQERNYIPAYDSAMNYLYQFSRFGLSTEETKADGYALNSGKNFYDKCPEGLKDQFCFVGQSTIPADWKNLVLRSNYIGKADGIIGVTHEHDHLAEEDLTVYELAVLAAADNNLKAGALLIDDAHNGIVLNHPNNAVNVRVENKGIDAHTFTVEARWGNGKSARKDIALAGIADKDNYAGDLAIPMQDLAGVKGPNTPVELSVKNQNGETVFDETFRVPVLDLTKQEAEKVLKDLPSAKVNKEEQKKVEQVLRPVVQPPAPTTSAPSPAPTPKETVTVTPTPKPAPAPVTQTRGPVETANPSDSAGEPSDGSSANGGAIAGAALVILGALTALFGWWFKNGEQFKLPF